ncbi:MAG: hypothetical protein BGO70_05460 [Bacteroidetes bacterium 43-93]|jgi:hypothetical protein|nr:MAG: hypothetical protein BGO70_05460 [Bacteroidetes bacterium 43-93]
MHNFKIALYLKQNRLKMKTVLSIAAVALFTFAFTSCKKDYTCTCTKTEAGTSKTTVYEKQMRNQTKPNAKATCQAFEDMLNVSHDGVAKCTY